MTTRGALFGAFVLVALARPAAALFEDLPPSARALGMGTALTSFADDAWAAYYNPAMLPRLPFFEGGVSTAQPNGVAFNRLTTIAVASPLRGRVGGLAFGWRHFGVENGDADLLTENTLSLSHGFKLFGDASTSASFGWTLNFYQADFANSVGPSGNGSGGLVPGNAWAVGVDIAAVVTVFERTYVGFTTRNLNAPTIGDDAEELRRQVTLGISYRPYPGVTTAFDVTDGLGEEFRILGGLEFEVVPQLQVRFGLGTEPTKVHGGFSVHVSKVSFDYGFGTGGGVLDATHQFGIRTRLDLLGEGSP
ncbi:MAG TPA: hypothetical protein VFN38_00585 [Gemmatimonadaceae bacterium]|nr:hypothetical protein [Gemmatimonadaceae bacterium]